MINDSIEKNQKVYSVSLTKTEVLQDDAFVYTFAIREDRDFQFLPGQYVWLILPELVTPDQSGSRRAFSIISTAADTRSFQILFRKTTSGYNQTLVAAKPGYEAVIEGPFGSAFDISADDGRQIVMVSGGVGIAPFLSVLRTNQGQALNNCQLLFVDQTTGASSFCAELTELTRRSGVPFFFYQEQFNPKMLVNSIDYSTALFFVCGSKHFVAAVVDALTQNGVPLDRMRFEHFYPEQPKALKLGSFSATESEHSVLLQALHDSSNHVIITDPNGVIIFANKAAEKTTGYTFSEMQGQTPRLWGGMMPIAFYRSFWKQIKTGVSFDGEFVNRKKNGELYHVIAHVSPILSADGTVIGFIGTEENITRMVRLQKILQEQKEQLDHENAKTQAILQNIGDGLAVTDREGKISCVNRAFEEVLGWEETEILNKDMGSVVPRESDLGDPIDFNEQILARTLAGTKIVSSATSQDASESPNEPANNTVHLPSLFYYRKNKTKFPAACTVTPVVVGNQIVGAVEVFRDVSREHEIDKAKTEFVSIASHQLRTPLGIIKWYLEAIRDDDYIAKAPSSVSSYLDEIYKSNERVLALVRDLLSVSRIDQGRVKNNPLQTDVVKVVTELVQEMNIMAKQQNISLTFTDKTSQSVSLLIDQVRLHEAVGNLISNALEFTPSGGRIVVTAETWNDYFQVSVADTGIGISPSDQKKLFSKFTRLEKAAMINPNGTGLGLYVVKSYVDSWGGTVTVDSQEGAGATFTIRIPLKLKANTVQSE